MSRVILVTGAGGAAGQAVVRRFTDLGDTVIVVDRSGAHGCLALDLLDRPAVQGLANRIADEHGRVDGVVHLVGGWRGAPSFAETDLADWDFLHDALIRTLQHVSLAFEPLLRRSDNGRFVIVSARAAQRPSQRDAAYAAAKAAAEAWALALADALQDTRSAAVILVVTALVHDAMRAAEPGRSFERHTDVNDLAVAITDLWDREPGAVNGRRIDLTPAGSAR